MLLRSINHSPSPNGISASSSSSSSSPPAPNSSPYEEYDNQQYNNNSKGASPRNLNSKAEELVSEGFKMDDVLKALGIIDDVDKARQIMLQFPSSKVAVERN